VVLGERFEFFEDIGTGVFVVVESAYKGEDMVEGALVVMYKGVNHPAVHCGGGRVAGTTCDRGF